MTATIKASLPIEEKIEFIRQSIVLVTSDKQVEERMQVECTDHQEMLDILHTLGFRYKVNGENDRYIILPPIVKFEE